MADGFTIGGILNERVNELEQENARLRADLERSRELRLSLLSTIENDRRRHAEEVTNLTEQIKRLERDNKKLWAKILAAVDQTMSRKEPTDATN